VPQQQRNEKVMLALLLCTKVRRSWWVGPTLTPFMSRRCVVRLLPTLRERAKCDKRKTGLLPKFGIFYRKKLFAGFTLLLHHGILDKVKSGLHDRLREAMSTT
jgi:hypothetical protein